MVSRGLSGRVQEGGMFEAGWSRQPPTSHLSPSCPPPPSNVSSARQAQSLLQRDASRAATTVTTALLQPGVDALAQLRHHLRAPFVGSASRTTAPVVKTATSTRRPSTLPRRQRATLRRLAMALRLAPPPPPPARQRLGKQPWLIAPTSRSSSGRHRLFAQDPHYHP